MEDFHQISRLSGASATRRNLSHLCTCAFWGCTVFASFGNAATASPERFENPPRFKASELLPEKLMRGAHHSIKESVRNDGYMNHYVIHSDVGNFSVASRPRVEKLVHEIYAIVVLEKNYPSADVALSAGYKIGKNIVTAPIRGAEKLLSSVSDPRKLAQTAMSVPGGVANLFSAAADAVSEGADYVYKTGKSVVSSSASEGSTSDYLMKGVDFAQQEALNYTGYTEASQDLYQKLRLDPYTRNEKLRYQIGRVAAIKASVNIASKFAPGLPALPYVGTANNYIDKAQAIAAFDDPQKVDELNRKVLSYIHDGDGGDEEPTASQRLLQNPHYNRSSLRFLTDALHRMAGVEGRADLVAIASEATSVPAADFYTASIVHLANYHSTTAKIREIATDSTIPAGITIKKRLLVPLAIDYGVWTEDIAKIFSDFAERVKREHSLQGIEVRVAGDLSSRTKKELRALGVDAIRVKQGY